MVDYLFNTNPGVLSLQTEVLTANFIMLAICILGVYILKRRREFIKLNKDQRLALRKAFKINSILSTVLLLFIVFRIAQVSFLSMRFLAVAVLIAVLIIFVISIIKMLKARDEKSSVDQTADDYSKYLPHKKKK